ncbi:hypothetical protein ON010_g17359 [Phytophthora cinnamomi]|nr:hypothetical protein ON010_g17359 [Phytophthora cinnamomi]
MDGLQYIEKYLIDKGGSKTDEEKVAHTNLVQNLEILDQSIDPYISLRLLHDEAEAAFKEYGEAMKMVEEAKATAKSRHSKAAKSNLKAAAAAMRATKANYSIKLKRYTLLKKGYPDMDLDEFDNIAPKREVGRTISSMIGKLEGRGLRGRGRPLGVPPEGLSTLGITRLATSNIARAGMKPLDGVKRKTNQTYNLNDIQGLATPSAYIYRKLGSKFIRLPDLDKRTLTIVQPNRKKVGPMREISDSLQTMIKDLVFRNDISQEKYDKLSIDDKKLFKEILEMTHLQYNFDQNLEDPLESLRMEYDKVKGELMLGNTNPSILKQLKMSFNELVRKICDPSNFIRIRMLVLDPKNIGKSGGLYNLDADRNLTELKSIMKDLLVKEVPFHRFDPFQGPRFASAVLEQGYGANRSSWSNRCYKRYLADQSQGLPLPIPQIHETLYNEVVQPVEDPGPNTPPAEPRHPDPSYSDITLA